MNLLKILLILSALALQTNFSAAQIRVVVLGSSTAAGVGPKQRDSCWVNRYRQYLLAQNPENELINLAVGGYSTYHILPTGYDTIIGRPLPDTAKNITKALSFDPDALLINMPSNDASQGYSLQEQLANYDTILALAGAAQVPVWIASTQPRHLSLKGIALLTAMRDSTFTHFGAQSIDFWTTIAQADTICPIYNSGDGIHLNSAGHHILLQRVIEKNIPQFLAQTTTPDSATYKLMLTQNPQKTAFSVVLENDWRGTLRLEVLNLLGEVLVSEKVDKTAFRFETGVATSTAFPKGSYQLVLKYKRQAVSEVFVVE